MVVALNNWVLMGRTSVLQAKKDAVSMDDENDTSGLVTALLVD
jgi:hypothetical protein